jgi:2-polyprenyl-3-methyl-5-hydroxy-6-metoxy-1,4-benzoquinol methylase
MPALDRKPKIKSADAKMSVWSKTLKQAASSSAAHVARYTFALKYVQDKTVCDIACGTGYGSWLLGSDARQVVGIDIAEDSIKWAQEYFNRPNIKFIACDIMQSWPGDDMFDVITSFETMEHVTVPSLFLNRFYERLKPSGKLILSVPNGPRDKAKTVNPYHLHHFTQEHLKELFSKNFSTVRYFSQEYRKGFFHYGTKLLHKLGGLKKQPHFVSSYYLKPGLDENCKTWVVIADK